jgi:hypothetical protein
MLPETLPAKPASLRWNRILPVLTAGLLGLQAQAAEMTWKSVVIGGGGYVPGLVTHPTIKGLMYARTDMGGAYRWNPASASWIPLTDWLSSSASNDMGVQSIALDPRDGARVALLTGKYTASWGGMGRVLISTDTGLTFKRNAIHMKVGGNESGRNAGERMAWDPNNSNAIYIANSSWDSIYYGATSITTTFKGSVWRSIDGGTTFDSLKNAPTGSGLFVVLDPASGKIGNLTKTIYASFDKSRGDLAGVWRSVDAGATWSLLAGQPDSLKATNAVLVGNELWISFNKNADQNNAGTGKVMRYSIIDSSWHNQTPPSGSGYGTIAVSRQNPSLVAVGTMSRWAWEDAGVKYGGDGVWLSRDKGATWKFATPTNDFPSAGTIDNSPTPWKKIRGPHWISGVAIDPFDSSVALYATGAGVYRTRNLLAASPTWTVADSNLEEIVSTQVVAPPAGAPLLTSAGDQGGFRHEDLDRSPASTHVPDMGSTMSLAVAWRHPEFFVKAHSGKTNFGTRGTWSIDSGKTWTGFVTQPSGTSGGGTRALAVSAQGSTILWCAPGTTNPYWSADTGRTWTASTGLALGTGAIGSALPLADKVDDKLFYVYDRLNGAVYTSHDGARTFSKSATAFAALPSWSVSGDLVAVDGHSGEAWLTTAAGTASMMGLWHTDNGGSSFTRIGTVAQASLVGVGAPLIGSNQPTLFVWGTIGGTPGLFRSSDSARTWTRVNDDRHQYGTVHQVAGDPRVAGRVFLATEGRGVIHGDDQRQSSAIYSLPLPWTPFLKRNGRFLQSPTPIELFDLRGRSIRRSEAFGAKFRLDLSGLPGGVYLAGSGREQLSILISEI